MIGAVKEILRRAVAASLRWRARLSGEPLAIALVYHRVGDPGEGRWERLVPALGSSLFRSQVEHLLSCYRPMPASELLTAARARRRGDPIPVAITFDDDLRSHLEVAAPILRAAGAPATFFLTGATLDGPFAFWWERLERAIDAAAISQPELAALTGAEATSASAASAARAFAPAIEAMAPEEQDRVSDALLERLGSDPPSAGLRSDEVRRLAASFEIGFHTRRHRLLTRLDDEALDAALRDGRDELERTAAAPLRLIAYPHGKANARVAASARAAGYEVGFTGAEERIDAGTEPLLVGRFTPRYAAGGRFALQLGRALRADR